MPVTNKLVPAVLASSSSSSGKRSPGGGPLQTCQGCLVPMGLIHTESHKGRGHWVTRYEPDLHGHDRRGGGHDHGRQRLGNENDHDHDHSLAPPQEDLAECQNVTVHGRNRQKRTLIDASVFFFGIHDGNHVSSELEIVVLARQTNEEVERRKRNGGGREGGRQRSRECVLRFEVAAALGTGHHVPCQPIPSSVATSAPGLP